MTAPHNGLPWDDILELHVIRKLAEVIQRRWGLGIGFTHEDGSPVRIPSAIKHEPPSAVCGAVQEAPLGERACHQTTTDLFEELRDRDTGAVVTMTCHAGLGRIGTAVQIDGRTAGMVWVGGFLPDSESEAALTDRVRSLGLDSQTSPVLAAGPKRLSPSDQDYLGELVRLVAEEIVTYQTDVMHRDRHRAEAPGILTRYSYEEIVGHSRPMQELYRILDKVIGSDSTVLIHGENGTGKELVAKAIHHNSPRRKGPFVVQNCSAFNDNLLDSELFGHKKGSFTGAIADKRGLFEVADGGTFFLDEIGDMSPTLQVKLLRVLQEGTFIPVGGTQPQSVDVRIIAATNRDLKRMVERGEFREDLYYRINVISITAPPLRERRDDIPALVDYFLHRLATGRRLHARRLDKRCLDHLIEYDWPGNVRELENEIERLVVLAGEDKVIGVELLSPRLLAGTGRAERGASSLAASLPQAVVALERTMIREALERHQGNKTQAALALGISRRNLIRKVNRYKLDRARSTTRR